MKLSCSRLGITSSVQGVFLDLLLRQLTTEGDDQLITQAGDTFVGFSSSKTGLPLLVRNLIAQDNDQLITQGGDTFIGNIQDI